MGSMCEVLMREGDRTRTPGSYQSHVSLSAGKLLLSGYVGGFLGPVVEKGDSMPYKPGIGSFCRRVTLCNLRNHDYGSAVQPTCPTEV